MHPGMLSELSYVGSRPYIRGADLYDWFERQLFPAMDDGDRPRHVRRFKLIREVRRDGIWSEGGEAEASAAIEVLDQRDAPRRYAFRETGAEIVRRVPDIPSALSGLRRSGDFAGMAELNGAATTIDFLNGLIEANKRLHAETLKARGLSADRIRLIYVENFPAVVDGRPIRRLDFAHLGERRGPDRTYTLNAVRIAAADALRICFSY
jgi:hypothetical protein